MYALDGFGAGGTELNAIRTLEQLDRERYDVRLVALTADGPLRPRFEAADVPITALPIPNMYGPTAMRRAWSLVRLFRRWRPDVVHCHDRYTNSFVAPCARVAGVPTLITSRRWWSAMPRPLYRHANRLAYRISDYVVANSESVAELVRTSEGVAADRVVVVPNFLEEDAYLMPTAAEREDARRRLGVPAGAFVVGCVAKLRPEKDHASLLRALAGLRETAPDVHLVLVGDGPHEEELRALASELGVGDRVHFAGFIPNRPNPHAWFDVSVLCSLHEGFPNSVIEAMAVARPVVATAVGGIPDVVADGVTGLLVPPSTPRALADAVTRLRADHGLARRLGEAARDHVLEHHSQDRALTRLEALYRPRRPRGRAESYIG